MGLKMPVTTVQIAFDAGPGDPISSMVWTTIPAVQHVKIKRGRNHELGQVEAATADIRVWNSDARFNTWNSASPYWHEGHGLIPKKPVRIRSTWDSTTYYRFFGYIKGFPNEWPDEATAYVTLQCVDGFYLLNERPLRSLAYSAAVLADGADGYWRLGDPPRWPEAADATVHARHGQVVGAVGYGTGGALAFDPDSAADFTNYTGMIRLPAGAGVSGSGAMTVETWLKYSAPPDSSGLDRYYDQGDPTVPSGLLLIVLDDGRVQVEYFDGVGLGSNSFFMTSSRVVPIDGNWHHVVWTRASDGLTNTIYIDGATAGAGTADSVATVPGTSATIAGSEAAGGPLFNGQLDEFAVYSTEIDAATVLDHYNAGVYGFPQESSSDRVGSVLDGARWQAADRNIDAGASLVATGQPGGGTPMALAHLQQVDTTEAGLAFMSRNGKYTFRSRTYLLTNPTSIASQVTLSDVAGEPYWLDGTDVTTDDADVYTEVVVTRQGGGSQVARADDATVDDLGLISLPLSTLDVTDVAAYDRANWELAHHDNIRPRVSSVKVKPMSDPAALWPVVLGLDLLDQVTFERLTPGSLVGTAGYWAWGTAQWGSTTRWGPQGVSFAQPSLIEGYEETIEPDSWEIVWHLSPADTQTYWVWGTATWGESTRWAF